VKFLVWRSSISGRPSPAIQDLDPRQSMDWGVLQQSTIAVIPLVTEGEQALTLRQAIERYPCKET